jgi:hypothetical protein
MIRGRPAAGKTERVRAAACARPAARRAAAGDGCVAPGCGAGVHLHLRRRGVQWCRSEGVLP